MGSYTLFTVLLIAASLFAIVRIHRSTAATRTKMIWTAVVLLLPVIGVVLWLFFGPT